MKSLVADERLDKAGPMGPAAVHLACALRPDERFRQREGASARTRGLRPASPVGPGTETSVTERARRRRRCPAAALSEGTRRTGDRAGRYPCPRDRSGGQELASRPGRRVPLRAMTATPGGFPRHPRFKRDVAPEALQLRPLSRSGPPARGRASFLPPRSTAAGAPGRPEWRRRGE